MIHIRYVRLAAAVGGAGCVAVRAAVSVCPKVDQCGARARPRTDTPMMVTAPSESERDRETERERERPAQNGGGGGDEDGGWRRFKST